MPTHWGSGFNTWILERRSGTQPFRPLHQPRDISKLPVGEVNILLAKLHQNKIKDLQVKSSKGELVTVFLLSKGDPSISKGTYYFKGASATQHNHSPALLRAENRRVVGVTWNCCGYTSKTDGYWHLSMTWPFPSIPGAQAVTNRYSQILSWLGSHDPSQELNTHSGSELEKRLTWVGYGTKRWFKFRLVLLGQPFLFSEADSNELARDKARFQWGRDRNSVLYR